MCVVAGAVQCVQYTNASSHYVGAAQRNTSSSGFVLKRTSDAQLTATVTLGQNGIDSDDDNMPLKLPAGFGDNSLKEEGTDKVAGRGADLMSQAFGTPIECAARVYKRFAAFYAAHPVSADEVAAHQTAFLTAMQETTSLRLKGTITLDDTFHLFKNWQSKEKLYGTWDITDNVHNLRFGGGASHAEPAHANGVGAYRNCLISYHDSQYSTKLNRPAGSQQQMPKDGAAAELDDEGLQYPGDSGGEDDEAPAAANEHNRNAMPVDDRDHNVADNGEPDLDGQRHSDSHQAVDANDNLNIHEAEAASTRSPAAEARDNGTLVGKRKRQEAQD
jgi:hypothetical protein